MGDIKYPYIGKLSSPVDMIALFISKNRATPLTNNFDDIEVGEWDSGWYELAYTNITREYLANTWGVVESKEHAEFIIELAENAGFKVWSMNDIDNIFSFMFKGGELCLFKCKVYELGTKGLIKITIPLPPKAKEWPQVGDEVVTPTGKGKLVVANPDKQGVVIVLVDDEDYGNIYKRVSLISLQKPKTPDEELRDVLKSNISESPKEGFEKAIDKVKSLQQDFSSEQATLDCKELDINVVFTGEGVYVLDCINSVEYQLESVDEYNKVISAIRLLQSKER